MAAVTAMPTLRLNDGVYVLQLGTGENRFSTNFLYQINVLLDDILANDKSAALIVTGSGKYFSNGLDVQFLATNPDRLHWYVGELQRLLVRFLTFPMPTVAAVNGHAFGAGAVMMLACDYRVMRADKGFFCLPEVTLGMPFPPGIMALCQRKMSARAASATLPTGRRLGGDDCLYYDIVDAAVPEAEVLSTAQKLVTPLVGKNRRSAVQRTKREMYDSIITSLLADPGL